MPIDDPISRRDFLRHGALLSGAALAASASGLSWLTPSEADAAIMGIGKELRDVLNLETVNQILIEALKRGGDYADLFAEQRFKTSIVLDDQKIDSVTYGYPRGAGVRVFFRKQTGYAFSDEIAYSDLLDAAHVAAAVVLNQGTVQPLDVRPRAITPPFYVSSPVPLMEETRKFDLLRRMDAAARAVDPRVVSVRIEYQDEVRDTLIGTSDGGYAMDRQYLVSVGVSAIAASGSDRRTGRSFLGGRVGEDYFLRRDPEGVAKDAAAQA
ncbi:MAG TPA: DNA gyrase modulator, partial [Thermoanaerobaculia bacterium]|nr:DNA gyrase modulator [Thermoanaerobaculia bacterium]